MISCSTTRKPRLQKTTCCPSLYLRVTIGGQQFEVSSHRHIASEKWSIKAGRVKGNTEEARKLNAYLDLLRSRVYTYHQELLQEGQPVTMEAIKDRWLGVTEKPIMLLEVFQRHNDQVEQLVGKDIDPGMQ